MNTLIGLAFIAIIGGGIVGFIAFIGWTFRKFRKSQGAKP